MKPLVVTLVVGLMAGACNQAPKEKTPEAKQKNKTSPSYQPQPFTEFYPSGKIKVNGLKQGDDRVGTWSSWFETGEKKSEASYENGLKQGSYRIFHRNGQVQVAGYYEKGIPSGEWKSFDSTGTQIATKIYDGPTE